MDNPAADTRLEAAGAFAHDMRTPLTSIVMVLDIARGMSADGGLTLDEELETMLRTSVEAITQLVDDFHESSRIQRSLLTFATAPTDIQAVIVEAAEAVVCDVSMLSDPLEGIVDAWDEPRLTRAMRQLIDATDRLGDGAGAVSLVARAEPGEVIVELTSGAMNGDLRAASTDAGYPYFHGCLVIEGLGGSVDTERTAAGVRLTVRLPRR